MRRRPVSSPFRRHVLPGPTEAGAEIQPSGWTHTEPGSPAGLAAVGQASPRAHLRPTQPEEDKQGRVWPAWSRPCQEGGSSGAVQAGLRTPARL